jgi:biopolymer transport protein TolR
MSLRRRRGSRHTLPMNAEINITNLVDVAFVLLIVFMITAPMLQGGVQVQLPQAAAAPITASEGLIVTVSKDGKIYLGDVPVSSIEEFQTVYPQVVRSRNVKDAFLKADREVDYGRVLQVLGMMKKMNIVEVGLVAEPELLE